MLDISNVTETAAHDPLVVVFGLFVSPSDGVDNEDLSPSDRRLFLLVIQTETRACIE